MDRILLDNVNIRKIIIGDIKDGIPYTVGQQILKREEIYITKIIRDENAKFIFGNVAYLIYTKREGEQEKVWKLIEKQPVVVEFVINES